MYIIFFVRFRSCFTHEYRLPKANITPLGISLAPLAQISIYLNIPSSTVAATTVRLPHKDCFAIGGRLVRLGKNRRTAVNLFHKARQSRAGEGRCGSRADERRSARLLRHAKGVPPFPLSGKSTPQRLLRNRGKVGMGGERCSRDICAVGAIDMPLCKRRDICPRAGNRYSRSA